MPRRPTTPKTVAVGISVGLSILAVVALMTILAIRYVEHEPPASPTLNSKGMQLREVEQFDGPAGQRPNPEQFDYDLGGGGWSNSELQVYTSSADNVRLSGTGDLLIEARRTGDTFTSARVVTRGKASFGYGLLEARIKLPGGEGVHAAFGMLGTNSTSVGFPACGEIDVVDLIKTGEMYHNAIRGPMETDPNTAWRQSSDRQATVDLAAGFRTYQVYRAPGLIRIGIDGYVVGEYKQSDAPPGARWVFDEPMYVLLNVAIGGDWSGPVTPTTTFPATMLVDWIRFWE
jgi:beta-glucanase (GH16 family)